MKVNLQLKLVDVIDDSSDMYWLISRIQILMTFCHPYIHV